MPDKIKLKLHFWTDLETFCTFIPGSVISHFCLLLRVGWTNFK